MGQLPGGWYLPSSKLTWQQRMDLVKMYLVLKMGDINSNVIVHQRVKRINFLSCATKIWRPEIRESFLETQNAPKAWKNKELVVN